tara:strand:+ start:191 stop:355 length:165 start_codon:yes stop_codon:yes gene_type:complete
MRIANEKQDAVYWEVQARALGHRNRALKERIAELEQDTPYLLTQQMRVNNAQGF